MIGFIRGTVVSHSTSSITVLTDSGLGYDVFAQVSEDVGQEILLFCSQIIRENAHDLYGFKTKDEKALFQKLIQVNGVGPKSAYALISSLGVGQIVQAIMMEDKEILRKAPGIGPKAAAQLLLDMKNKIQDFSHRENFSVHTQIKPHSFQESLVVLKELGYQEKEVLPLLAEFENSQKTSSDLVKEVLKRMM